MKDDSLTLEKSTFNNSYLKMNGYYYVKSDNYEGELYDVYFFYKNGIIFNYGGVQDVDFVNEKFHQDLVNYDSTKDAKYSWGVYTLDGDNIKFERWYPSEKPYKSFIREGTILNDSTFRITRSYRSNGKDERIKDELYHFKEFSPKPDSTNTFIK